LREYRYHQDAATGSIRADEEADMYELCDLDVKASEVPGSQKYQLF
jgi:hypothetical protein